MSFVGSMFSNGNGAGYQAQGAPITQAPDFQSLFNGGANANVQNGIQQQQDLYRALQAQGGIQNQSNVFGQQQALADQLGQQAQGQGPNPALAQLNQTTGQNIAAQNALMAGQRGSGANAGLLARQAAMQGANTQQQAVGQGATMQAQQQIAAQQALMSQQANMANLSTQQVGQQQNALAGYNSAAQNEQGQLLGALGAYNNAQIGMQSNMNNNNVQIAKGNQGFQQGMFGGLMNSMSSMIGMGGAPGMAHGGQVHNYAGGGMSTATPFELNQMNAMAPAPLPSQAPGMSTAPIVSVAAPAAGGPQSQAGQFLNSQNSGGPDIGSSGGGDTSSNVAAGQQVGAAMGNIGTMGMVNNNAFANKQMEQMQSMGSSGGGGGGGGGGGMMSMLPMLAMLSRGGQIGDYRSGGNVPGQAKVSGDSETNDTVDAKLSPGEVVIPRSIINSPNAPEKAAQFVANVLARKKRK